MNRNKSTRDIALKASRAYHAHRAYYEDLFVQRDSRLAEVTERELDFLERVFRADANRPIKEILDVACGSGRHIFGLARKGYKCTGLDFTPERIKIAKERAKHEGLCVRLLQGDATQLAYEGEFDAVLALYVLSLLPSDDDVVECLRRVHRALRKGGVLVCNIGNPFFKGKAWFSIDTIHKGLYFAEVRVPGMRDTEIATLRDFDPIQGVAWWQETDVIEAPDGTHVFRDQERLRLFTYWDILHYLEAVGFKEITCYPDWKSTPEMLSFVARKD